MFQTFIELLRMINRVQINKVSTIVLIKIAFYSKYTVDMTERPLVAEYKYSIFNITIWNRSFLFPQAQAFILRVI